MKVRANLPEAYQLFHDGTLALSRVEENGMRVDVNYLDKAIKETAAKIKELKDGLYADPIWKTWRKVFGEKANLVSRPQLAKVVFGELGYESRKKTEKTGQDKADESAFSHVTDLPFLIEYFKIAKLEKAKTTYLEGIRDEVVDGLLHPNFNLHTVVSMRGSSNRPNFQNFPIRDPMQGELIRRAFISRDGWQIAEVDFSGIEVRIANCYHKDPTMTRYIKDTTTDMHRDTACDLFMIDKNQVTKLTRYMAKNQFVFPQFYGSVYFQCAPALWENAAKATVKIGDVEISLYEWLRNKAGIRELGDCISGQEPKAKTFERHVKKVEDSFWNKRFPVYTKWKKQWYASYKANGHFNTLTGFCLSGLFKKNEVLNYGIQGDAFHCLLWSMIQIQRVIRKRKMKSLIVGQIHDSIVFDVAPGELSDVLALAKQVMTVDLLNNWKWINVPLGIEAEVSPVNGSWHEKKSVPLEVAV